MSDMTTTLDSVRDGMVLNEDLGWGYFAAGLLHRLDGGPALRRPNGDREWRRHGVLHRDGGLPAIVRHDDWCEWWVDGLRHRGDGPAVEGPHGYQEWWIRGHRVRRPAVTAA